jgi:hypothetical protein
VQVVGPVLDRADAIGAMTAIANAVVVAQTRHSQR